MFYTKSVQGGADYANLNDALEAAQWQGQFCPCAVFEVGDEGETSPLAEFWPDD